MYLRVLNGKLNYKNSIYKTGDYLNCQKDIGIKLVKSEICEEISEDKYQFIMKLKRDDLNNISAGNKENNLDIKQETSNEIEDNKSLDDLRDEIDA